MSIGRFVLVSTFFFSLTGCGEEGVHPAETDDAPMPDAMLRDALIRAPDDAATPPPSRAVDAALVDAGTPALDAGTDPVAPDAAGPPPIDSCARACARYAACERLDLFGDEDACLAACDRVVAGRRPVEQWYACLEVESCNLLHLCPIPELVPLTCDEACGEMEACGVEYPFPDCRESCAAVNDEGDFGRCAEHLYGGRCGDDAFWACLGEEVYTDCAERCQLGVECNSVRPEGCLQGCVAERFEADPLRRLRGEQKTQCVRFAVRDCGRIDECLNPRPFEPIEVSREVVCGLWNQCFARGNLDDEFHDCDNVWEFSREREGGAECLIQQLRRGCPPDPQRLLEQCLWDEDEGGFVFGPHCPELCEAQSLCGGLEPGQNQQGCNQACTNVFQRGDQDARTRLQEVFPCGLAESCDALDACLVERSPAGACAAHCDALAACGEAPEDCREACDRDFYRLTHTAWRDCVAEAGEACAEAAACAPAPTLSCAAQCDRTQRCGRQDPNCVAQCEDLHHTDPARAASTFSCVQSALCRQGYPQVVHCRGNPTAAGGTCLAYCRAATGCDPQQVDALQTCIIQCGEGFEGEDADRFEAARGCLEARDPNGACAPLTGCLPDPVQVDCPAWCAPLEACALLPAQCGEACAEDALARRRGLAQQPCLAEAGEDCGAAADCIGHTTPRAAPSVEAVCDAWAACNLDEFGACDDFVGEVGERPGALRCFMEHLSPCPRDPEMIFQCFDEGDGGASVNDCRAFCEAQSACGRGFGIDGLGRPCADGGCPAENGDDTVRGCTETCMNRVQRAQEEERGRLGLLLACGRAQSCGDLDTCLVEHTPEASCVQHCRALEACDAAPDQCEARCGEDFFRDRDEAWRRCVSAAGGECEAVAACAPPPPLPCDVQCARFAECGVRRHTCVEECRDLSFTHLDTAAQRLACTMSAPLCNGRLVHTVQRCRGAPHVGGKACLGFCRAQTGCDPGAVEALGACILRCGAGMTGDEGLAFASARHCLDGLDAHAQCPALEACIPPAVQVDCAEWCGPLEGCGAEPEGCAEACDADPLARLRALTQTACLGAADDDCDAALECIDTSIEEPPPVDAAMYCARYRACGFEREIPCDQFLQEFIEDPDEDHWMPCAFAQMDPCPDNPWDPIERCFGGHEAPPELGTCKRLCQAEGFCGSEDSVRVCTETCVNQVRGDPDGPRAEAVRCRDALTCGELAACVAAEVP